MTLLKTLFIAAFCLLADRGQAWAAEANCLGCHPTARAALSGPMSTRAAERAFAHRAFGKAEGDRFFEASCSGCHVSSCNDCHGTEPHRDPKPKDDACLSCHRGYFVGWDYYGRAPREDHARYRRGAIANGEPLLKMLPDVHRERGMTCALRGVATVEAWFALGDEHASVDGTPTPAMRPYRSLLLPPRDDWFGMSTAGSLNAPVETTGRSSMVIATMRFVGCPEIEIAAIAATKIIPINFINICYQFTAISFQLFRSS